jgi:hypothetical protein
LSRQRNCKFQILIGRKIPDRNSNFLFAGTNHGCCV